MGWILTLHDARRAPGAPPYENCAIYLSFLSFLGQKCYEYFDLLILLLVLQDKHIRKPLSSTDPTIEMEDMYPVYLKLAKLAVTAMAPLQKLFQIMQRPKMNTKNSRHEAPILFRSNYRDGGDVQS